MDFEAWSNERLVRERRAEIAVPAFAEFYRRSERLVAASAMRRMSGSVEVAAEVTAETYARAIAARTRFRDRGPGSAIAWLLGISRHVQADLHRATLADRRTCDELRIRVPVVTAAAHDELVKGIDESRLLGLLGELPEDQRKAIWARFFLGQNYDQVAAQAGTEPATVRKRVSRGLRSLRHRIMEAS